MDTAMVTAVTTMAMLVTLVSMAMLVMMAAAWKRLVAVAVAEVVVTEVAIAAAMHFSQLPLVNDVTFVTMMFLTRPMTSIHCWASARGRPPATD